MNQENSVTKEVHVISYKDFIISKALIFHAISKNWAINKDEKKWPNDFYIPYVWLFQEHPFIRQYQEVEVDTASYFTSILDQVKDSSQLEQSQSS